MPFNFDFEFKKASLQEEGQHSWCTDSAGCAADVLEINMDDDLGCVLSTKYRAAFQAVKYALKEMATSSCRLPAVKPSDTGGILKYNNAVEDLFSKLTVPEHHMLYLFVLCIYFDALILI